MHNFNYNIITVLTNVRLQDPYNQLELYVSACKKSRILGNLEPCKGASLFIRRVRPENSAASKSKALERS